MSRGVLYIVWGDKVERLLQRSMESLRKFYPDMPIHVERGQPDAARGLQQKSKMGRQSPYESTLFLDADTVVLGNLDFAFDRAEEFGLACSICECPWTRRYGQTEGDNIEYNTGVIFFTAKAKPVMDAWESIAPSCPSTSRWTAADGKLRGLEYDDQASFARAVRSCNFNPYVLPLNYNFRPGFHRTFFTPMKVWHSPHPVPPALPQFSTACEAGQRPVTFLEISTAAQRPKA